MLLFVILLCTVICWVHYVIFGVYAYYILFVKVSSVINFLLSTLCYLWDTLFYLLCTLCYLLGFCVTNIQVLSFSNPRKADNQNSVLPKT